MPSPLPAHHSFNSLALGYDVSCRVQTAGRNGCWLQTGWNRHIMDLLMQLAEWNGFPFSKLRF